MDAPPALAWDKLLSSSVELLRKYPLPLVLPAVLVSLLTGSGDSGPRVDLDGAGPVDPGSYLPFYFLFAAATFAVLVVIALVVIVLILIVASVVWTATARAMLDALATGAEPDIMAALRAVSSRWSTLAVTLFFATLAVIVGFILLIVPGVILLSAFLPVFAILAAESVGGIDALKRSWALTMGHKGALAMLVVLGVLVEIGAGIVFGFIPIIGNVLAAIVGGAVTAVWLAAGAILYRAKTAAPPVAPA